MFPNLRFLDRVVLRLHDMGYTAKNNPVLRTLVIEQAASYFPEIGRGHGANDGCPLTFGNDQPNMEHCPGKGKNAEEHLVDRRIIPPKKKTK